MHHSGQARLEVRLCIIRRPRPGPLAPLAIRPLVGGAPWWLTKLSKFEIRNRYATCIACDVLAEVLLPRPNRPAVLSALRSASKPSTPSCMAERPSPWAALVGSQRLGPRRARCVCSPARCARACDTFARLGASDRSAKETGELLLLHAHWLSAALRHGSGTVGRSDPHALI